MQHRSKHNAEDEIASPRKRVNGNADPHSRIVRNAKLCVLILLFIILPSCKHGSCKECRSLVGQNDRYKYSNTKCNYFHQKFCKFRKYFLPGVVAFEDFRKASFLISASHTSVLFCPQLFIPQQQETCQDAWLLGCPDARMKCAESGIFKIKNRKCHPVQGDQGSFG